MSGNGMRGFIIDQRLEALMGSISFSAFNRTTDTSALVALPNGSSMLVAAAYTADGTLSGSYPFVTRIATGNYLASLEARATNDDHAAMRVRVQNETAAQQNTSENAMSYVGVRSAGKHVAVFYLNQGHTSLSLWIDSISTTVSIDPGAAGIQAQTITVRGTAGDLLKNSAAWSFGRPAPSLAQVRAMQGYMRRIHT